MKDKEKKIIIAIFIILIIILIIIIILLNRIKQYNGVDEGLIPQDSIIDNEPISRLDTYYIFVLENKINMLLENIQIGNTKVVECILNNSNEGNIINQLPYTEFFIQEVYASENEKNGRFYIYGLGKYEKDKIELEKVYFVIDVDYKNSTFEIILSDLVVFEEAKTGNQKQVQSKIINQNGYNKIQESIFTTRLLLEKYITDYKNKALYNINYAYEMLDETCKSEKYKTMEEYRNNIENNKENVKNLKIVSYNKEIKDEYIQYNVILYNGIECTIKAKSLMDYTIYI